jgi:hypothetical protein
MTEVGDDGSGFSFSLRGRSVRGLDPVAGRWVIRDGVHAAAASIGQSFAATLAALAADVDAPARAP